MNGRIFFVCFFTLHGKQITFVRSFFGRIYGSPICFSISSNLHDTSGRLVFVRFLEEIDNLKNHFKINWPLQHSTFKGIFFIFFYKQNKWKIIISVECQFWPYLYFLWLKKSERNKKKQKERTSNLKSQKIRNKKGKDDYKNNNNGILSWILKSW